MPIDGETNTFRRTISDIAVGIVLPASWRYDGAEEGPV